MGIKTRILEQIKMKEISPEAYQGTDLKENIEELEKSDKIILDQYPAEDMKRDIMKKITADSTPVKLPKSKNHTSKHSELNPFRVTTALAAVMCLALLLPLFLRTRNNSITGNSAEKTMRTDRIKGFGAKMFLYKQEGKNAVQLYNRSTVEAGDTIQISYTSSGTKYGFIVSIDGNGTITRHFPEHGYIAAELKSGGEIPLDYSYQLDNAPSFERFLFISGNSKFSVWNFIYSLKNMDDVESIAYEDLKEYLPPQTKIHTLVLLKE